MQPTRIRRAALVPLMLAVIAVGALAIASPAGTVTPPPAKGVHHVERPIPVELGPATVVVP
jgi:hypothetical protein